METKHTPGPWYRDGYTVYDAKDAAIVECDSYHSCDEDYANANLIAAAPDMLEALQMAMRVFDKQRELLQSGCKDIPCPRDEALDILRAALAKAEGR